MTFNNLFTQTRSFLKAILGSYQSNEYYLKFDGYYYDEKKNCVMGVIKVRNKRSAQIMPILEIVKDKSIISELCPSDSCILGMVASHENNGLIDRYHTGWENMLYVKDFGQHRKPESLLRVTKKDYLSSGEIMTTVYSAELNTKMEIDATSITSRRDILNNLSSLEALSIGYCASEVELRKEAQVKSGNN
jgi:hypothetical protein